MILRGSFGNLRIHRKTGAVLEYDPEGNKKEYADIARIDLAEYKEYYGKAKLDPDEETDIMDVGFWTKKGQYYLPGFHARTPEALRALAKKMGIKLVPPKKVQHGRKSR